MSLLDRVRAEAKTGGRKRETKALNSPVPFPLSSSWSLTNGEERIENDFDTYIDRAYKASSVAYACISARQHIFSQARFLWRSYVSGTPGDLFGSSELGIIQEPAPGMTTAGLLKRMEVVASIAGNWYGVVIDDQGRYGRAAAGPGKRIVELRPDWVTIIIDSPSGDPTAPDARIVGYQYEPTVSRGTRSAGPVIFTPEQMCHYAPEPDPGAQARGMSWLTPVIQEIEADQSASEHKRKFFQNSAMPSAMVALKDVGKKEFQDFVERFKAAHKGSENVGKTLFLSGGADVTPLTHDLQQLDLKNVQGAIETRIAAASGMHPVIIGLSEGMQGSSLNQGNFAAARRLVADKTMRHLWTEAASSLQRLVTPPAVNAQLWPDLRDVAFLREDQSDLAQIQVQQATALRSLLDAGYDPDAAINYIRSDDLSTLVGQHSGLFSVQLQPPGTTAPDAPTDSDTEQS